MSVPSETPQFTRREIKKRARQWFPVLIRSMSMRTLLYVLVLLAVGMTCKPWKWEWLRPDEASSIAEQFLYNQGVKLDEYTLIQAAEYKYNGVWNADRNPHGFGFDPAVGYVNRYFHVEERDNSWNIHVSPAGRIYNLRHNVDDLEPGFKLSKEEALSTVHEQLGARLGIAVDHLVVRSDSLAQMPQRNDYYYTFFDSSGGPYSKLYDVRLTGNTLTSFAVRSSPDAVPLSTRPPGARLRLLAFALMVFGVFQIILHHRHPISWRRGMWWGSVAMIIVLIARALTISQATLLVPGGSEAEDFVFRVALAAAVEAIQSGIVVTLIVASGESIARDIMPNITTLTRIAPSHRGWTGAWIQSARWALPAAALFLLLEAWLGYWDEPGGLAGESLRLVADIVGSPLPALAAPVFVAKSILWEELVFRLWLFPLLVFWVRGAFTAMLLMAGIAAYFVGFDTSQWLTAGAAHWFAWSIMAAWLFMRVGILGALMFHALVLGGFLALALVWIGFAMPAGVFLITLIVGSLAAVAIQAEVVVSRSAENT
ncbi:MAG: CPBP family intramembrane metalloprotease [Calditrichaeota bacterium]|nr:CPBP family intramembrane metalloprotease [Calditrichota bacterium]MCB9369442.1 CPBP family intramembrane metalloprotease [Calditrichota bacterium]